MSKRNKKVANPCYRTRLTDNVVFEDEDYDDDDDDDKRNDRVASMIFLSRISVLISFCNSLPCWPEEDGSHASPTLSLLPRLTHNKVPPRIRQLP